MRPHCSLISPGTNLTSCNHLTESNVYRSRCLEGGFCGQSWPKSVHYICELSGHLIDSDILTSQMPYLHWEIDKRRHQMATITREITHKHMRNNPDNRQRMADNFRATVNKASQCKGKAIGLFEKDTKEKPSGLKLALGEYLTCAAKIYDAMDIEHDVLLLNDYLQHTPPIHGRRTLGQSYYWKINDTSPRDRDQVVYRATKMGKDTRKTTRVIMVDQLWLYILDDRKYLLLYNIIHH